jgi:endonuclease/exonuclease/phosphatase (EEP) superfamily protein YafD
MLKFVLLTIGAVLVAATLLSRIRSSLWWVRFTDFPRLQIAVGLMVTLTVYILLFGVRWELEALVIAAMAVALGYQLYRIFPYMPGAPKQVVRTTQVDPSRVIKLLISNVLMENRRVDDFLRLIGETDPDVVLAVETNSWWDEKLKVLDDAYPLSVKQPQENYYGMHLFSRLELVSPELRFLVEEEIPSVKTGVRLRTGEVINFYGVHPRPPDPGQDTEERDAEILIVAREVKADGKPSIIAGDLNDVAWSRTTWLFQRIGEMLDPRRGRGMYSTFHAGYPMLRWPLDHIFHESSFVLVRLERLRSIGSDHFPVLAELQYQPLVAEQQEAPEADAEDRAEAQEKIDNGVEAAKVD